MNGAQSAITVGVLMTQRLFAVSWGTLVFAVTEDGLTTTTVKPAVGFGWIEWAALAQSWLSVHAALTVGVRIAAITVMMLELFVSDCLVMLT